MNKKIKVISVISIISAVCAAIVAILYKHGKELNNYRCGCMNYEHDECDCCDF